MFIFHCRRWEVPLLWIWVKVGRPKKQMTDTKNKQIYQLGSLTFEANPVVSSRICRYFDHV